jgi:hypothetical protein
MSWLAGVALTAPAAWCAESPPTLHSLGGYWSRLSADTQLWNHGARFEYGPESDFTLFGSEVTEGGVFTLHLRGVSWSWRTIDGGYHGDPGYSSTTLLDHPRGRLVRFEHPRGDVFEMPLHEGASWRYLLTEGGPSGVPSGGNYCVYDAVQERMLLFTGDAETIWSLPLDVDEVPVPWSSLSAAGGPGILSSQPFFDPVRNRVIYLESVNRLWVLTLSGTPAWTLLLPTGPAPLGFGLPIVYNQARDCIVVTSMIETSVLDLSSPPRWSLVTVSGTVPPYRVDASAVYDPVLDRMLIHGGLDHFPTTYYYDTWSFQFVSPASDVNEASRAGSIELALHGRHPGRGSAGFTVGLATAGPVSVEVFDARGARVRGLVNGTLGPGRHPLRWDGKDENGRRAGAGVYFAKASTPGGSSSRRFVLLK